MSLIKILWTKKSKNLLKGAYSMKPIYTIEELTAINALKPTSRNDCIITLQASLPYYSSAEEQEEIQFTRTLLEKLKSTSDDDFENLSFENVLDLSETDEK